MIPIVFAVAVEPLSSGLVANLARPGGNLTGLSSQTGDLGGNVSICCARLSLAFAG